MRRAAHGRAGPGPDVYETGASAAGAACRPDSKGNAPAHADVQCELAGALPKSTVGAVEIAFSCPTLKFGFTW